MPLTLDGKWIWDSWYLQQDGRWHAWFLQADRALGDPELRHFNVSQGHAVSDDLKSWSYLGTSLAPQQTGFDSMATWTGSVVTGPDGLHHLFYTGCDRAEGGLWQRIGHAVSRDLHAWERVGSGMCLDLTGPAAVHYEAEHAAGHWPDRAMRDPWVMPDPEGGGWLMYFTARVPGRAEPNEGGAIGFATSPDLVEWTLPILSRDPDGGMFGPEPVPADLHVDPDHPVARRIAALSEPRLSLLRRPFDEKTGRLKAEIPVDAVRALKRFLSMSAADGGARVVIVDAADEMNTSAANALLKLLEEPPKDTVLILVSHQPGRLLPTIRSRCRVLRLPPLAPWAMAEALAHTGADIPGEQAAVERLALRHPRRRPHRRRRRRLQDHRVISAIAAALRSGQVSERPRHCRGLLRSGRARPRQFKVNFRPGAGGNRDYLRKIRGTLGTRIPGRLAWPRPAICPSSGIPSPRICRSTSPIWRRRSSAMPTAPGRC
nr:hypothetical protein [Mangrovicoccus ximenensis]